METGKVEYAPDYKSDKQRVADHRKRAAGAVLRIMDAQAERAQLEREVIKAAKKWATLRFQPHFGGMITLEDELQEATTKTLIDFESSQQQVKK